MAELEVAKNCIYNSYCRSRVNSAIFVSLACAWIPFIVVFGGGWLHLPEKVVNALAISSISLLPPLVVGGIRCINRRKGEFGFMLLPQLEDRYVADLKSALHVGMSPGTGIRNYAGDSSWDVGFLLVEAGLIYYGDQCRFFLTRSDIVQIKISRCFRLLAYPRLLIQFRHESGDTSWISIDVRAEKSAAAQLIVLHRLQAQIALMPEGQRKNGFKLPPSGA